MTEYLTVDPKGMRPLQEQLVAACFGELDEASGYDDLCAHAQRLIAALENGGFQPQLQDEDGESMLVYGISLAEAKSITLEAHWDLQEGVSLACIFIDGPRRLILAQSHGSEVVEVGG